MSYDIIVMNLPPQIKSAADIPKSFVPLPVGKRSEVIGSIKAVVPTANFADPSWGLIDGQGWSIEVSLGAKEDCSHFAFHIRGGDAAFGVVAAILEKLNLRAFDCQAGELFAAGEEATESFQRWKKYRDDAVASHNN